MPDLDGYKQKAVSRLYRKGRHFEPRGEFHWEKTRHGELLGHRQVNRHTQGDLNMSYDNDMSSGQFLGLAGKAGISRLVAGAH